MIKEIELKNGLLDIQKGIIVHQVNCKNAIGARLSGVLIKKYPIIREKYKQAFKENNGKELYGKYQEIKINEDLKVINMFSQYDYGIPSITHKVYTNYDHVVNCLTNIVKTNPNENIYIPNKLGCGLAGGNWNILYEKIKHLPITIVKKNKNLELSSLSTKENILVEIEKTLKEDNNLSIVHETDKGKQL